MRKLPDILIIILVLLLIVLGQVLAKSGAVSEKGGLFGLAGLNCLLSASYLTFLLRGGLWAWVLRRNPVSRVYPYLSLAYPLILLTGVFLFGEELSPGKIAGTVLILSGSILLASGEPE